MKIHAASRLQASSPPEAIAHQLERILGIKARLLKLSPGNAEYMISDVGTTQIQKFDDKLGAHKEGRSAAHRVYVWEVVDAGFGIAIYSPFSFKDYTRMDIYDLAVRASVVRAYDNTWIKKMNEKREYKPPKWKGQQKPTQLDDHIFNMQPGPLSQNLKTVYKDDYDGAMGVLNLYKNRQGKNLKSPDRDRLDKAKTELRKKYGKDDGKEKTTGPKPSGKSSPADVGKPDKPIGSDPIGSRPTTRTI